MVNLAFKIQSCSLFLFLTFCWITFKPKTQDLYRLYRKKMVLQYGMSCVSWLAYLILDHTFVENICHISKLDLCNYSPYHMDFFVSFEMKWHLARRTFAVRFISPLCFGNSLRQKHDVSMVTDLQASWMGQENFSPPLSQYNHSIYSLQFQSVLFVCSITAAFIVYVLLYWHQFILSVLV